MSHFIFFFTKSLPGLCRNVIKQTFYFIFYDYSIYWLHYLTVSHSALYLEDQYCQCNLTIANTSNGSIRRKHHAQLQLSYKHDTFIEPFAVTETRITLFLFSNPRNQVLYIGMLRRCTVTAMNIDPVSCPGGTVWRQDKLWGQASPSRGGRCSLDCSGVTDSMTQKFCRSDLIWNLKYIWQVCNHDLIDG